MPCPFHVFTLICGEEHTSRSSWRRPSVQPPFQSSPLGPNLPQHPIFKHSQRMCSLAHPLKFVTNWSLIIVSFNTHNCSQCNNHSRKPSIKTSVSAWKDRTRQTNTNYCPCKREIRFFWVIALYTSVSERNAATVFKAQDVEFATCDEQLWQVFYDTR
jgi:hypothetical protein